VTEAEAASSGQSRLSTFLSNNPEAICSREGDEEAITYPWGVKSLTLAVSKDDDELVAALNTLRLPPRFTAIWHYDTKDLEVIYGPLDPGDELSTRSFEFEFGKKSYMCEFREASDRLLLLARAAKIKREVGLRDTRNLELMKFYIRAQERADTGSLLNDRVLTSFWIHGIEEWDENVTVDLVRHLNFYMRYFDRETLLVAIHEDLPDQEEKESSVRYPYMVFPKNVSAQLLDSFLLGLWESSVAGNPRLRFLYSYQIMEYATFYHASDAVQQTVRRAIMAPHTKLDPTHAVTQILDALAEDKRHEKDKMQAVVLQSVDPRVVWRELQPHAEYFGKDIVFDGGVSMAPLIKPDWGEEDFAVSWHPKFIESVRSIRNALVHGREQRMSNVISPTRANDDRLRPWLAPLSVAAEQVILCRPS
jgi:hypothetical protein